MGWGARNFPQASRICCSTVWKNCPVISTRKENEKILTGDSFSAAVRAAVPLPSASQAFFKIDARLVTEDFPAQGDVRLRVADVSCARRFVFRANSFAGDLLQKLENLIERDARPGADIEDPAGSLASLAGAKRRVDDVVHIGEVAGLLPIPEHDGLRVFNDRQHEARKHAGVLGGRILARAEDIEISQRNVFESVVAAKDLPIKFAYEFRDAVRRNGFGRHGFDFGQSGSFAIRGRRSSENDAADFGVSGSDENIEHAVDIHAIRLDGISDGSRDAGARGQMQDAFGAAAGFARGIEVGDAGSNETDLIFHAREIFFFAGGKIVEDSNIVASAQKFINDIGADESGAAGHQIAHCKFTSKEPINRIAEDGKDGSCNQLSGIFQSSGGKLIRQNLGEGLANSMPTCAFPSCIGPTYTMRQSCVSCVAL